MHDQYQTEDWMLICQRNANCHTAVDCDINHDWSASNMSNVDLHELPTFITRHRQAIQHRHYASTADPCTLQGKQLATYNLVGDHFDSDQSTPLRMVVSGIAGTGTY